MEFHGATKASLENLREGRFREAWSESSRIAHNDPDNAGAVFIAAVSLLYLNDLPGFHDWLAHLQKLQVDSAYTRYLSALQALLNNDEEKAIYDWTHVIDFKEGWLALKWLERIKNSSDYTDLLNNQQFAEFILLPGEEEDEITISSGEPTNAPQARRKKRNIKPIFIGLIFLISFLVPVLFTLFKPADQKLNELFIEEHISLAKNTKNKFKYTSNQLLLQDFNLAKNNLKNGKINQARITWNKIILSNADFKTIEKAKVYLRFIPEPKSESFEDNLLLKQVLAEPVLHKDCYLFLSGMLIAETYAENGRIFKIKVINKDKERVIQGFMPEQNNQIIGSLKTLRSELSKEREIAFLGQFKGFVGSNKDVYFEVLKVWM